MLAMLSQPLARPKVARRCLTVSTAVLLVLLQPAGSSGAPPVPRPVSAKHQAMALARDAVAAAKGQDFARCAELTAQAYALDPEPKYLWNLARCQEQSGKLAEAVGSYRELTEHSAPGEYGSRARLKIAELEPRLVGGLALSCSPADAVFVVEGPKGTVKGRCPWQQDGLAAGSYRATVEAPGHRPAQLEVEVPVGKTISREVKLEPLPAPALSPPPVATTPPPPAALGPPPVAPPASAAPSQAVTSAAGVPRESSLVDEAPPPPGSSGFPWLGVSLATAAAGLATGFTGMYLTADGESTAREASTPDSVQQGNDRIGLGNGLQLGGFAVGAAAGLAAALIGLLAEGDGATGATAHLAPTAMPGGMGLAVRY